jgi:outer membrane protein
MVPLSAAFRMTFLGLVVAFATFYGVVPAAVAEDLVTVYQQAAATSPVLARARSLLQADEATLPLARSNLLPHLSANAGVGNQNLDMKGFGDDFGIPLPKIQEGYSDAAYSVSLTQPIVNGQAWVGVRQANARIRAGQAAVLAVEQDLVTAVADAYFGILRAEAEERVSRNQKELLQTVLNQTEAFLKVGSGDIIAVQEAKASLDAAAATLIRSENGTRIAKQRLERLTHQSFGRLVDLGPLTPEGPNPNQVGPWLSTAKENQPLLNQAREQLQVALDEVEIQRRAHWPKLNLGGGYSYDKGSFLPSLEANRLRIGLNLSLPLYEGGEISAKTKRAAAQAKANEYHLKDLEDQILLDTENAFLLLQNSVPELLAAQQAVASNRTSLEATRKGYEIGSRSVVDLLKVAHDYEAAQRNYCLALYQQVMARVRMKAASGVLSEEDVKALNGLLISGQ